LINCHEAGRELILDILELDRPVYDLYQPMPDVFREAPASRPVRYVIDLEKRVLLNRRALHYERCADFPAIDPQRLSSDYDDFWLLGISDAAVPGPKFFDQLAHGSWKKGSVGDIHRTPAGEYLGGEPVFIGNPANPKEGLILVQGVNPAKDQGEFLLFDAFAVQRGPVVRLPLRDRMPPLFHACFAAAEAG
jgi:carotenoid cleavage dioxygenase-like enzyme